MKIFYFSDHGSASGLRLKNTDPSLLAIGDPETIEIFQLFGRYAYRPDIVINACSTGDTTVWKDPIAEVCAREMYGRAYGAASDAGGIYDIELNFNELSVEDVKFTGAETNVFDYRDIMKISSLEENNSSISIFPNPVATDMNVKVLLGGNKIISLEIFDLNGRKIQETRTDGVIGENRITIPLNNFRSGVYILRVCGEIHKIIKNYRPICDKSPRL
ncbi:T9SS type A sorting domain-containing protein [Candidatus Gracilibacteria bacterium]|nr:T9SS type A sorting domain-containing protein [Candidatus Gracilibacteria bacterium]